MKKLKPKATLAMQEAHRLLLQHCKIQKSSFVAIALKEMGLDSIKEFKYIPDTSGFYERNKYAIWDLINETAHTREAETPLEFLASLDMSNQVVSDHTLKHHLVLFVLEEVSMAVYNGEIEMERDEGEFEQDDWT